MSKFVVMATWDDVPHLTKEQKDELWASIPPFQRKARSQGIPQLGAGVIYPLDEDDVICDPFEIPSFWPRAFGMDVGWNRSAAVWSAHDEESGVVYLYSEYYRSQAEPAIHAEAIKSRGSWIPGVIDPAAKGRSMVDGKKLVEHYTDLGLMLELADNATESGIQAVWDRLSSGRLKVFSSLQNWRNEFRVYRRDEKGRIVKKDDHLMDATRYLIVSGLKISMLPPSRIDRYDTAYLDNSRSSTTGY